MSEAVAFIAGLGLGMSVMVEMIHLPPNFHIIGVLTMLIAGIGYFYELRIRNKRKKIKGANHE